MVVFSCFQLVAVYGSRAVVGKFWHVLVFSWYANSPVWSYLRRQDSLHSYLPDGPLGKMFGLKPVLHNCRIREKTRIFDTFCGKCGGMFLFSVGGCIWFSCGCWIILARSCLQLVCKFTSLKLPPSPRQFALIPTWRTFGKDVWVKTSAAQLQNSRAREDYKMVEENTYDTVCGKCGGMFLFSVGGCIWFSCGCWKILARSCLQLVCKFTSLKLPPSPRQFALIPTWRTFGKDV